MSQQHNSNNTLTFNKRNVFFCFLHRTAKIENYRFCQCRQKRRTETGKDEKSKDTTSEWQINSDEQHQNSNNDKKWKGWYDDYNIIYLSFNRTWAKYNLLNFIYYYIIYYYIIFCINELELIYVYEYILDAFKGKHVRPTQYFPFYD